MRREVQGPFLSEQDVTGFVDFMAAQSVHVDPAFLLRPALPDPDDDFVLELAFGAGVDYLVTHNVRDFSGAEGFGVRSITPGGSSDGFEVRHERRAGRPSGALPRTRAARGKDVDIKSILAKAPDVAPMPGDEIES